MPPLHLTENGNLPARATNARFQCARFVNRHRHRDKTIPSFLLLHLSVSVFIFEAKKNQFCCFTVSGYESTPCHIRTSLVCLVRWSERGSLQCPGFLIWAFFWDMFQMVNVISVPYSYVWMWTCGRSVAVVLLGLPEQGVSKSVRGQIQTVIGKVIMAL